MHIAKHQVIARSATYKIVLFALVLIYCFVRIFRLCSLPNDYTGLVYRVDRNSPCSSNILICLLLTKTLWQMLHVLTTLDISIDGDLPEYIYSVCRRGGPLTKILLTSQTYSNSCFVLNLTSFFNTTKRMVIVIIFYAWMMLEIDALLQAYSSLD